MDARSGSPAPSKGQVLASAAGLGAATTLVALVDPYEGGRFPACPLLALTGLYCPFCGGLRAVHDLTHLDLAGALERNPLVVVGLPFIVVGLLLWGQRAFTGKRLSVASGITRAVAGPVLIGLLVLFGVLRNLPGWTWLSPA